MARTPSNMVPLGMIAPDFTLPDTHGQLVSLDDNTGSAKGYLVMFICNHCPYVLHVLKPLVQFCRQWQEQGIRVLAINANDVEQYPEDHPDKMKILAQELRFSFPYLYDQLQTVAQSYQAACTPDFYLFNGEKKLVYRGQMDDARPGNPKPIDGHDLQQAIDGLCAGLGPLERQIPSLGCNIKWRN